MMKLTRAFFLIFVVWAFMMFFFLYHQLSITKRPVLPQEQGVFNQGDEAPKYMLKDEQAPKNNPQGDPDPKNNPQGDTPSKNIAKEEMERYYKKHEREQQVDSEEQNENQDNLNKTPNEGNSATNTNKTKTHKPKFKFISSYNRTTVLHYKTSDKTKTIPAKDMQSFGTGILNQYKHFLAVNPNHKHETVWTYDQTLRTITRIKSRRYNIREPAIVARDLIAPARMAKFAKEHQIIRNEDDALPLYILQIQIDETRDNKRIIGGGTTFRVTSESKYHTVCGVEDKYDGRYLIFCPVYGTNTTLSIQLSHIDFESYKGHTTSYDKYIWFETLEIEDEDLSSMPAAKPWAESEYHRLFSSPHGIWHGGDMHTFQTHKGAVLPVKEKFICDCIRKLTIYMVGSSHMRNSYYCLQNMCSGHKVMKNIIFEDGLYMEQTAAGVDRFVHNASHLPQLAHVFGEKRVIVLQAGAWDLGFRDFKNTTFERLPIMLRNLSKAGERVVVMGTPSLPNQGTGPKFSVARNNEATCAFNQHESEVAQKLGLEFVDIFSATFPRYRERNLEYGRRTHHYVQKACRGAPGMISLQILFDTLCPNTAQNYDLWETRVKENYQDDQERLWRDYGEE